MILLDPRAGSADYEPLLRRLGAPVELVQLDFADVAFFGSGRAVGIELKKFDEFLTCIETKRFVGHQLRGLVEQYDIYGLIVEGLWRPNPEDGVLETWGWNREQKKMSWVPAGHGKRRWMFREFHHHLTTLSEKTGLRVERTASENETARVVYDLYDWWQDYQRHKSHLAFYRPTPDRALFFKPTLAYRVAAELPGCGFEKSSAIARAFPSVRKMIAATEKEWQKVDGIGKKLAKGIVEGWDSEA